MSKEEIRLRVNLGAITCKNLKDIFFPDTPWVECHKAISDLFTKVKVVYRSKSTEDDETKTLTLLSTFTKADLIEFCQDENIVLSKEGQNKENNNRGIIRHVAKFL